MNSLADLFPQLASEWDYDKNAPLTPHDVTPGQHKNVYWKCPICKQSYPAQISNRTSPSRKKKTKKCPVCLGRTIIPGFNSLKALFPDIVSNEWDYDLNSVNPDELAPHTNKVFYWKCLKGHPSYKASVNNKTSKTGGNCPYCSHQKFSPENSLLNLQPDLNIDWDYEANGEDKPGNVFAFSNKLYSWKCHLCGHRWEATPNNRSNGRGCPNCKKGAQTSFPEQVIFHYAHEAFPDAINRFKLYDDEIDIYLPSLNVGIEYDGEAFHRTEEKVQSDIRKDDRLANNGLRIIRIRERGCADYTGSNATVYSYNYTPTYMFLEPLLQNILNNLCNEAGVKDKVSVNINSIRKQIKSELSLVPKEQSFAYYISNREKEGIKVRACWDYEANAPLSPEQFRPFSEEVVQWRCPDNPTHFWRNTIKSVSLGFGCKDCSPRKRLNTDGWIQKAERKHKYKYDYSEVNYVNSKTPVIILCKTHGAFKQVPSEHLAGKGCPYCAHQKFHFLESLAVKAPDIAAQWNYELNRESRFTPELIGIDTKRKFWWHCTNGMPHSFLATVASRVNRHTKCAVCHGKQISYDKSIEYLFPELMKEWDPSNSKQPSELSKGSEYKAIWKCPSPNHPPYKATIYSRVHLNSGCPLCYRERQNREKK